MLGSHNALSYLSPKGLKSKLLNKWAKCQEISYMDQYSVGVRYFDIHIKFEKNKPVVVHNNVTYKGDEKFLDQVFGFFNNMKDCYVRLLLDVRSKPKDADKQVSLFTNYIESIQKKYLFVKFADAIVFWSWTRVLPQKIEVTEKHASVTSTWELVKSPKNYAKNNNTKLRQQYKAVENANDKVLLIDFVNL
jgi:hypothetical protein